MHNPGGESILAGAEAAALLRAQIVFYLLSTVGIGWVCRRIGGRFAAIVGVAWWLIWPTPRAAASHPYYYFWPIPFTVGLACLWVWRGTRTLLALPLLVTWAQFRMTAIGTFLTMPRLAIGVAAWVLTAALVMSGHGRTQLWHDLYIGIGCWPNEHGVVYSDEQAIKFAAARGVGFKAPGYEALLRDEYLRIVAADPLLVPRNFVLNFGLATAGWSFAYPYLLWWVPMIGVWAAWRRPGVYRALVVVWLSQCATLGFVNRPQEGYLWETAGLFVIVGAIGLSDAIFAAAREWEPDFP